MLLSESRGVPKQESTKLSAHGVCEQGHLGQGRRPKDFLTVQSTVLHHQRRVEAGGQQRLAGECGHLCMREHVCPRPSVCPRAERKQPREEELAQDS